MVTCAAGAGTWLGSLRGPSDNKAKDQDSYAVGGSQTMYLAQNGMFGVQGITADADTLGNVENLIPGEGFVLIKPEILVEAVRRYQEGLP